jgi:hypothetical protein
MARKQKSKPSSAKRKAGEVPVPKPAREQVTRALFASFLGWIFPGAGHCYLGKWGRGGLCFAAVVLLLALGVGLDGRIYRAQKDQPLTVLASFASMGNGPAHFVLRQSRLTSEGEGNNRSPFYEFGNTFILVAGLLNMLIILDAYDVGVGYKP